MALFPGWNLRAQFSTPLISLLWMVSTVGTPLRRGVLARFQDRKTIGKKMFEASQERWKWWDLRRVADEALEVAGFPKKLTRDRAHRHTCDEGCKHICWLLWLSPYSYLDKWLCDHPTCQCEFWFMTRCDQVVTDGLISLSFVSSSDKRI